MSTIREAIDAILRVDFRQASPADTMKIGDFLEQAAEEISMREACVTERERAVSAREATAELRESELAAQVKALASVQRVKKVLDLTPVEPKKVVWWKR